MTQPPRHPDFFRVNSLAEIPPSLARSREKHVEIIHKGPHACIHEPSAPPAPATAAGGMAGSFALWGCGVPLHMRASEARGIIKRPIYDAAAHRAHPPNQPPSLYGRSSSSSGSAVPLCKSGSEPQHSNCRIERRSESDVRTRRSLGVADNTLSKLALNSSTCEGNLLGFTWIRKNHMISAPVPS